LEDIRVHEALKDVDLNGPLTVEQHRMLIHPDEQRGYRLAWSQLLKEEREKLDVIYRMKNAQQHWVWFHDVAMVTKKRDGKVLRVSGAYTDISKQKDTELELLQRDKLDKLTGLPNRKALFESITTSIDRAWQSQQPLGLIFIDPDNFKHFNLGLGFEAGDQILRSLAQRLRQFDTDDNLLGRLESDQFILLLEGFDDHAQLERLAQQIMAVVCEPMSIAEHQVKLLLSIGIAMYPEHCSSTGTMVEAANLATCRAQSLGGQQYQFYHPDMAEAPAN
jgi:diguanylate cyclase (GGDEF)-like protein